VLAGDGIDASALTTSSSPTGRALIIVDDRGENSIVVVPGANHDVTLPDALPDTGVVLCQLEVPLARVAEALAAGRAAGATTILNPAPAAPLPVDLIAACDIVVPNEHEVELLGGVGALLASGCRAVVVTRGGAGVDVHTPDGLFHCPPFEVEVVDTTGAGDAFCGALAARLAAGDDLHAAVRWAAGAGALATTVVGAVPAQPTAEAIRALLAQ
jgi:ribokinase